MVILFKSNKSLVITSKSTIFQNENLADKLNIYVPTNYDDNDLSLFTAILFYKDGGNEPHSEVLTSVESDKENYLKYVLPVSNTITQKAGKVEVWLSLSYSDETDPEDVKNIEIHSDSVSFVVEKWDEYAIPNSISNIYAKVESLETKVSSIEEKLDAILEQLNPSEDPTEPDNPSGDDPSTDGQNTDPSTDGQQTTDPTDGTQGTDPQEP